MTNETPTDASGYSPPTPNPMFDGVNRFPRTTQYGLNGPLATAVRDFIADLPVINDGTDDDQLEAVREADGVAWQQESWRCETGMCFAGWTGAVTGAKFLYLPDASGVVPVDHPEGSYGKQGGYASRSAVVEADGQTWHVAEWARRQLGLTQHAANRVFAGGNDLADIDYLLSKVDEDGDIDEATDY